MKPQFEISISRHHAALYLAWEYGIKRALEILRSTKPDSTYPNTFILLTDSLFMRESSGRFTRRAANSYKARIQQTIAWQEGRLGRPLTGGNVYVIPIG